MAYLSYDIDDKVEPPAVYKKLKCFHESSNLSMFWFE